MNDGLNNCIYYAQHVIILILGRLTRNGVILDIYKYYFKKVRET
jgi:hypothetical protein